ncbi:MAG: TlpA family protein disulfide reductase [Bacteroidota bacterium]|nr:TlpA family protein disulfide reductase [Bacteroidota bacterium]
MYHQFLKDLRSNVSLEYDVVYQQKTSASPDTIQYKAHVHLVRIPEDKVFGGRIYINLDTMWYGFDSQNIMMANLNRSAITFIDGRNHPDTIIRKTFVNELIIGRFLEYADFLTKLMKDKAFVVQLQDTILFNQKSLAATITLPAQDSVKQSLMVSFNKANHFYSRNIQTIQSPGGYTYNAWTFSNPVWGNSTMINELHYSQLEGYDLVNDSLASKLKLTHYDLYLIEGQLLHQQKKIVLREDTTSRYIVLDCWHSICTSCSKTIPVINQLYDKYKGKGVTFYGINQFDTASDQKAEMEIFLKANPMKYPTIVIDNNAIQKIKIEGYPFVLIVDKFTNIVHKERGYKEGMFEKLSGVLDSLLSKS